LDENNLLSPANGRKAVRSTKSKIRTTRTAREKSKRSKTRRSHKLSDKRFQRGLRILQELKDLFPAARAAGISPKRFAKLALEKGAIRRQAKRWIVRGSLPRRMLLFSGGREVIVTVRGIKSASQIGSYMAAVRQFLRTNKSDALTPFVGRSIKDTAGKVHPYETNPNVIYRLSLAGDQAFEQIYRIVV
jgi:hypothetical protein